jgi:putative transcriptional regulator
MPISKSQQKKLTALGLKVKALREAKGMTLEALGEIINKERQSISRLEKGNVNPSYLYLLDICRGLGIDLAELIEGLPD